MGFSDVREFIKLERRSSSLRTPVQEATFMVTILGLVAGEVGISILPSSVQNLQRQGVVYRPIQEKTPVNQLIAVWRYAHSSMVLPQFLQLLKPYQCED